MLDEVLNKHLITKEVNMITLNPVKLNSTKYISFGNNNSKQNSRVGLMALDKNNNNKVNFEKDLFITQHADSVQSNPLKAIGYNFIKAYNILCTPKRTNSQAESDYIHLPYMA